MGVLAVLLLAGFLWFGHPAGAALADAGRDIAASNAASLRGIDALGAVDAGAPAAAWVLLVSVIVASALGSGLLAGPEVRVEDRTGRVPRAALLAHAGATAAALLVGGGAAFYATAGLVAAALLLRPGRAPEGPGSRRIVPLLLLGALLFVAAGGADGLLQSAVLARPLPEAWFVVAAESGAGVLRLPVLGTLGAVALAAAGMERAGPAPLAFAAASWALLLGPSNPCRALALAWSLRCLARAGLPPLGRAAYAAALVAGMAALVFA